MRAKSPDSANNALGMRVSLGLHVGGMTQAKTGVLSCVLLFVACAVLLLSGCASAPQEPLPTLKLQALEAESQGAKRYAQGRLDVALAQFRLAEQISRSIDDEVGVQRNLEHQARTELAAGDASAAQTTLSRMGAGVGSSAASPSGTLPGKTLPLSTGLLQVQTALALQDTNAAAARVNELRTRCNGCAESGAIAVMQARVALAQGQPAQAEQALLSALKPLAEQTETRELANAWRLLAQAQGQLLRKTEALASAQQALALDRALALPEKIAADWMLIARLSDTASARAAYQHARAVAQAAGLPTVVAQIDESLKELK